MKRGLPIIASFLVVAGILLMPHLAPADNTKSAIIADTPDYQIIAHHGQVTGLLPWEDAQRLLLRGESPIRTCEVDTQTLVMKGKDAASQKINHQLKEDIPECTPSLREAKNRIKVTFIAKDFISIFDTQSNPLFDARRVDYYSAKIFDRTTGKTLVLADLVEPDTMDNAIMSVTAGGYDSFYAKHKGATASPEFSDNFQRLKSDPNQQIGLFIKTAAFPEPFTKQTGKSLYGAWHGYLASFADSNHNEGLIPTQLLSPKLPIAQRLRNSLTKTPEEKYEP